VKQTQNIKYKFETEPNVSPPCAVSPIKKIGEG